MIILNQKANRKHNSHGRHWKLAILAFLLVAIPSLAFLAPSITARAADADIYPVPGQAQADLAAGLKTARATHKHIILDFGGNWCGDCKVLDINFHKPENQELLAKYYLLVDIDIGRFDKNMDIGDRFGVPIKKGVPALAVVDGNGKTVLAQTGGEFADMRHMDPGVVHEFLEKWKPKG